MNAQDVCLDAVDLPGVAAENAAPPVKRRGGGPKTPEGKASSCRNALKDGLNSKVILPRDMEEDARRTHRDLADHFQVAGPYADLLLGRLAFASVQLERCQSMTFQNLGQVSLRAANCWEEDQVRRVADLAKRLPRDPMRVASELRRTRQGAAWLIEQWEGLGSALDVNDLWDDDQRTLAFDLLGTHPALRDGYRRVPAPTEKSALLALVDREIARLEASLDEALDMLDEQEQLMAVSGLPMHEDARSARLRKYDTRLASEWKRAHDEVMKLKSGHPDAMARQAEFDRSVGSPGTRETMLEQARAHHQPLFEQMAATMEALDEESRALDSVLNPSEPESKPQPQPEPEPEPKSKSKSPARLQTIASHPAGPTPPAPKGNRRHRRAHTSKARRKARQQREQGLYTPAKRRVGGRRRKSRSEPIARGQWCRI